MLRNNQIRKLVLLFFAQFSIRFPCGFEELIYILPCKFMNALVSLKVEGYVYNFHNFVVEIEGSLSIKFLDYGPYFINFLYFETAQNVIND